MLNSIKKDINSYRYYITNKNSGIKKKNINSLSTYNQNIKPNLIYFLKYIEDQLGKKPRSLLKCVTYFLCSISLNSMQEIIKAPKSIIQSIP